MSFPSSHHHSKTSWSIPTSSLHERLPLPPKWLRMYDEFITKNASQVSQIESALRSLTYVIPGRFRDAEIASESIHSGVQLLSLYHDLLLQRSLSLARLPSPHNRYTRFWTQKSSFYRRVALVLQIVSYTELLCEMTAKRRSERLRWRVVVLIETVKALCRLALLRITRSRPLVTPVLPEREPVPDDSTKDKYEESDDELRALLEEEQQEEGAMRRAADVTASGDAAKSNGTANGHVSMPPPLSPPTRSIVNPAAAHGKDWTMPRTGMSLPSLPNPGDISSYLLSRVLQADDIKPATKLLRTLQGSAQAAEILHILAPLVFALALARSRNRKSWTPWLLGLVVELVARQLRDRGLRATSLEREEWERRGWALGWWAMRGAFYEHVVRGLVVAVRGRMPGLAAGILEDYEYLWENYYFSTCG